MATIYREMNVSKLIPPMPRKRFASCDQCESAYINGVFCHETGCPNQGSRWEPMSMEWVKQRECFECGCTVDQDDPCCWILRSPLGISRGKCPNGYLNGRQKEK